MLSMFLTALLLLLLAFNAQSQTRRPTFRPKTKRPSSAPSDAPIPKPSAVPIVNPTAIPTPKPTAGPQFPTRRPTFRPKTKTPTRNPSAAPIPKPFAVPILNPTDIPTPKPSAVPTSIPSAGPTPKPSAVPTSIPSAGPTPKPSAVPASIPSAGPTPNPTAVPTPKSSAVPTSIPSAGPTPKPSAVPTSIPSAGPTPKPSALPTSIPSAGPTPNPTAVPTSNPSAGPVSKPFAVPIPVDSAAVVLPLIVPTSQGLVQGILVNNYGENVRSWKGLRYAMPPVGNLRWSDPQPANVYSSNAQFVYNASFYRPSCLQTIDFAGFGMSEDCLFLNIFAPLESSSIYASGYPVLFFIHGDDFASSVGSTSTFDGTTFAMNEVILVTVNYRLNVFGFLKNADFSGNYGIKDQLLALRWVKANIANFGGDPNQITIGGHGAGGASVAALLIVPQAAGLFQKAIVESASVGLTWMNPDIAALKADVLFESIKVALFTAKRSTCTTPTCFKALPAADILLQAGSWSIASFFKNFASSHDLGKLLSEGSGPVLDSSFLPRNPIDAFKSGAWNQVPILGGTVEFEGDIILYGTTDLFSSLRTLNLDSQFGFSLPITNDADYRAMVEVFVRRLAINKASYTLSSKTQEILTLYPFTPSTTDGRYLFSEILGDLAYRCSTQELILASPFQSFLYEFSHVASTDCAIGSNPECVGKSCHGSDLMFLFNSPTYDCACYSCVPRLYAPSQTDRSLALLMNGLWSNFVKNGNPGLAGGQTEIWPAHTKANSLIQKLDLPGYGSFVQTDLKSQRCALWNKWNYVL